MKNDVKNGTHNFVIKLFTGKTTPMAVAKTRVRVMKVFILTVVGAVGV